MKVLAVCDGSGDGFEGLRILAQMFAAAGGEYEFALAVIGWPPRRSPLWDRAFERSAVVDDLHRAMAEVASNELQRLRELFEPLGPVDPQYAEGDPIAELRKIAAEFDPGLVVCGLTRQHYETSTRALEFVRGIQVASIFAFGPQT